MTYKETMTGDFFEAWFQKFLLPTLKTPSVIIMDNARFHRMSRLKELCEEHGHKLLPLSPYSPEYNPIEKTLAHIKKHLRKALPICNTFLEVLTSCSYFKQLYFGILIPYLLGLNDNSVLTTQKILKLWNNGIL